MRLQVKAVTGTVFAAIAWVRMAKEVMAVNTKAGIPVAAAQ